MPEEAKLRRQYEEFRMRRLKITIGKITQEYYERVDALLKGIWQKMMNRELLKELDRDRAEEMRKEQARYTLFSAGELKNPITLQSYMDRGANIAKKLANV